jgi:hypothetical protein
MRKNSGSRLGRVSAPAAQATATDDAFPAMCCAAKYPNVISDASE